MTPAELGLTHEEHQALLWVRNCLDPAHPQKMPDWMTFDMDVWVCQISNCGTACCIGGSMDIVLLSLATDEEPHSAERAVEQSDRWQELSSARSRELKEQRKPGLYNLFFDYAYRPPTRENAVAAIDAYLAGSENPWR